MSINVRERVDGSWGVLQDAIAGVPDERLLEPRAIGDWSVKDVLAHVAYWDDPVRVGDEDWQAANERVFAERADWPPAQVRAELEAAHGRMLAALETKTDVDPDDWEHYAEHAAEIRAWRERLGI